MKVTSVFVWIYVIGAVFAASPSVTNFEPRRNLTVPVTLSRNVTFVCTVDASGTTIPIWEVAISQYPNNQLPLTGRELQGGFISTAFEMLGIVTKDINLQNSTLDVTEAARRNNTLIQVQCNAFDIAEASCASGNCSTAIYYIITYGVPDPPQNLALQASSTSQSLPPVLSWQRPPNIPEDVPLIYHLQITNLTSNERVLTMTDRLLYPHPDGTGCSLFNFSVTASNDVGNSTTSSIMETVPITPDVGPINSSLRILSVNVSGGRVSFTLTFDKAEVCSERYRVTDYTVVSGDGSISVGINASSGVNNYTVTLDSANAPNLTRGFAYDISVIACNNLTCRESKTIEVFTTDVQNPSVRYVNNSVNLTCEFAEGSTAEGCIFNFTGVTSQQSFFVNRSGDSDVASRCEITRAFANNTDYIWSAFDNVGEVPVTVELIAVDSQDENNFTCLLLLSGPGDLIPVLPDQTPVIVGGVVGGGGLLVVIIVVTIIVGWCIHKKRRDIKKKRSSTSKDDKEFKPEVVSDAGDDIELTEEEEREPLLTCTMRVVCKKNGCVQFTTEYNEKAIKRRILAGKDEVIELVVATKQKSTSM